MAKKKKYIYSWDEIPYIIDPPYAGVVLGCTGATIRRLLREGKLKGFRVGEMWRIKRDDLKAYMERGETNA